ncbi:MAG TPA: alpha/beta hydrolase [Solimonas sp.]|nr:alpha/beta hydrolase [Solimonas sp.]
MPAAQVDDIRMNYFEAGSGPPLVLLHGLGGSLEDWESQLEPFAQRRRVIAPDLRGFGLTPRGTHAPTIARLAADVWTLLQQLGIARFALCGHSMGGAVALQLALDHPGAVDKLVIANSVPAFQPETLRQRIEIWYRIALMALAGPAWLSRVGAQRMFPGEALAQVRARSAERGARNLRSAYVGALQALTRWSVAQRLKELTMPALVVAAENDFFSHADSVSFAHGLGRGRLRTVKGTRHGLPLENPREFNRIVLQFLDHGFAPLAGADRTAWDSDRAASVKVLE